MLPRAWIQRMENSWETIADEIVAAAATDPYVGSYRFLRDAELRNRAKELVSNLSRWLSGENDAELISTYEALGRQRYLEGVPLQELTYKILLIKRVIASQVSDYVTENNAINMYSELQLRRAIGYCFDLIAYAVTKGYTEAWQKAEEQPMAQLANVAS